MNLIGWIVFGTVVALITNIVNPRATIWGLLNDIAMGVGGAVLGGLVWTIVLKSSIQTFNMPSLALALMGSLALLLLERRLNRI